MVSKLLYEDMIRAETAARVCRIWRQRQSGHPVLSNDDLKQAAVELMMTGDLSLGEIARSLIKHARVNSVEVIERATGDGVCVHKDWP
jgi:CTP:molybdopterin cytidylyltransferase MocA